MNKYKHTPSIVSAIQFNGDNAIECTNALGGAFKDGVSQSFIEEFVKDAKENGLLFKSDESHYRRLPVGFWIIIDSKDWISISSEEDFSLDYERINKQ